ncbi:MAG: transposase [Pirellulales bacterium]
MSNNAISNSNSSDPRKLPRRTFSDEFKRDAVNLVLNERYSLADTSRAVNVGYKTFRDWHAKFVPEPKPCGDDATVDELQAENKRLRKQLRQAEMEREI